MHVLRCVLHNRPQSDTIGNKRTQLENQTMRASKALVLNLVWSVNVVQLSDIKVPNMEPSKQAHENPQNDSTHEQESLTCYMQLHT